MSAKLNPLPQQDEPGYPKASGTFLRRVLIAASMAATSLGGCGPLVDPSMLDAAAAKGDLDATVDRTGGTTDTQPQAAADAEEPAVDSSTEK
ncbi:MAG TPA: hypothetical protein VJ860_01850 [Polyangia bacterium]|jgi:hypothetical protein|nr:hypothetical protein [Polyangia bacterium]